MGKFIISELYLNSKQVLFTILIGICTEPGGGGAGGHELPLVWLRAHGVNTKYMREPPGSFQHLKCSGAPAYRGYILQLGNSPVTQACALISRCPMV